MSLWECLCLTQTHTCVRHFSCTDLGLRGILSPTTDRGQQLFAASAPPLYIKGFGIPYLCEQAGLSSVEILSRAQEFTPQSGLSWQQHVKATTGPAANYHPWTNTSELIATARGKEEAKGLAFKVATSFRTSDRWLALQDSLSVRQIKS